MNEEINKKVGEHKLYYEACRPSMKGIAQNYTDHINAMNAQKITLYYGVIETDYSRNRYRYNLNMCTSILKRVARTYILLIIRSIMMYRLIIFFASSFTSNLLIPFPQTVLDLF